MKNSSILWLLIAAVSLGACSKKSGGSVKLREDVDSVAYILGMNVGKTLLERDSTLNVNALCEGIRDVFRDRARFTDDEAKAYYLRFMNYALREKARAAEEQFLEEFARSNRNYARTRSGVTYAVESVGDQEMIPAVDRDSVTMRIVIRSFEGEELYSSFTRGDSLSMNLKDMTDGLRECVKLIGEGGRITAWMPAETAYGSAGSEEFGIKPDATLFYEIDLVDLDKYSTRIIRETRR